MFSRTAFRISLASASALIVSGALAIPAMAAVSTSPIGPRQNFAGQVLGVASATPRPAIGVECINTPTGQTGHPVAGQSVEVQEASAVTAADTLGYTGDFGTEINASLIYSTGGVAEVLIPVATLSSYDVAVAIPTSITVPCSGSGVMSFAPSPDPDNTGVSSNVDVTFQTTIVVDPA